VKPFAGANGNPNIEFRNSKQIRNSNFQMIQTMDDMFLWQLFWTFEFWSFGIVSDFVLRISNLQSVMKLQF